MRESAHGYDHGRIGNRVPEIVLGEPSAMDEIPGGCAAVTSDESPTSHC